MTTASSGSKTKQQQIEKFIIEKENTEQRIYLHCLGENDPSVDIPFCKWHKIYCTIQIHFSCNGLLFSYLQYFTIEVNLEKKRINHILGASFQNQKKSNMVGLNIWWTNTRLNIFSPSVCE